MNKTKKKIVLAAIDIFNEQGIVNSKNQDISERAGISLSNFNYHFATKKDLVLTVIDYMGQVLKNEVYGGNSLLTKHGQAVEMTIRYFEFEQQFRFFYLDTPNILQSYPEVRPQLQEQIQDAIQMIKNLNYLSVGKGNMKAPPPDQPNLYDHLAEQLWVNSHFLFAQMDIRGEKGDLMRKGMETNFAILYPYLTEKGKKQYRDFLQTFEHV